MKLRKLSLEERIDDLIEQATTERSHYYTASLLLEVRDELKRLKELCA